MNLEAVALRSIIPVVLRQITKLRAAGDMTQELFESQLERLSSEELRPRGQSLLVRELHEGGTRFIVQNRDGTVCESIVCGAASDSAWENLASREECQLHASAA